MGNKLTSVDTCHSDMSDYDDSSSFSSSSSIPLPCSFAATTESAHLSRTSSFCEHRNQQEKEKKKQKGGEENVHYFSQQRDVSNNRCSNSSINSNLSYSYSSLPSPQRDSRISFASRMRLRTPLYPDYNQSTFDDDHSYCSFPSKYVDEYPSNTSHNEYAYEIKKEEKDKNVQKEEEEIKRRKFAGKSCCDGWWKTKENENIKNDEKLQEEQIRMKEEKKEEKKQEEKKEKEKKEEEKKKEEKKEEEKKEEKERKKRDIYVVKHYAPVNEDDECFDMHIDSSNNFKRQKKEVKNENEIKVQTKEEEEKKEKQEKNDIDSPSSLPRSSSFFSCSSRRESEKYDNKDGEEGIVDSNVYNYKNNNNNTNCNVDVSTNISSIIKDYIKEKDEFKNISSIQNKKEKEKEIFTKQNEQMYSNNNNNNNISSSYISSSSSFLSSPSPSSSCLPEYFGRVHDPSMPTCVQSPPPYASSHIPTFPSFLNEEEEEKEEEKDKKDSRTGKRTSNEIDDYSYSSFSPRSHFVYNNTYYSNNKKIKTKHSDISNNNNNNNDAHLYAFPSSSPYPPPSIPPFNNFTTHCMYDNVPLNAHFLHSNVNTHTYIPSTVLSSSCHSSSCHSSPRISIVPPPCFSFFHCNSHNNHNTNISPFFSHACSPSFFSPSFASPPPLSSSFLSYSPNKTRRQEKEEKEKEEEKEKDSINKNAANNIPSNISSNREERKGKEEEEEQEGVNKRIYYGMFVMKNMRELHAKTNIKNYEWHTARIISAKNVNTLLPYFIIFQQQNDNQNDNSVHLLDELDVLYRTFSEEKKT